MPSGLPQKPGRLDQSLNSHAENHTGIVIFDKVDPRSVYNLVSADMQEAIERVNPEYYRWSLKAIEKHAGPDSTLAQLRVAFWREYNYTQDNWLRSISLHSVTRGVCSKGYFYDKVLPDPLKLAYVLYPVVDMQVAMEEMMDLGLREMRKILLMPNSGKGGANLPVIKEKIKIVALLQNRLQGAVVQRVEKRTAVVSTHINSKTQEAPKSLQEIEREIRQIERTAKEAVKPSGSYGEESLNYSAAPEVVEVSVNGKTESNHE